jgi:magnesium transporter
MSGATTETRDVDDLIESLLAKADTEGLSALFDSMPLSDALRELLRLSPKERDAVLSPLPSEKPQD